MRHPGIDKRQNIFLHHLHRIDAGGRAPEIQVRDLVNIVLRGGDLVHLQGIAQSVCGATADKLHDRRRGGNRKSAQPGGLGNRAVADIRVGILSGVTREEQGIGEVGRAGEPAPAGAGELDPEIGAVAGHHRQHAAVGDPPGGIQGGLGGGHGEIEKKMIVPVDKIQYGLNRGGIETAAGNRRGQRAVEQ